VRGNIALKETSGRTLLSSARARLLEVLPPAWQVTEKPTPRSPGSSFVPDALFRIEAPDGTATTLIVEAKTASRRGWDLVIEQLARARTKQQPEALAVVDYAGPGFRRLCEGRDINYVDLTGWIALRTARPAIFITTQGATRDPVKRQVSGIARLSGRSAGRILRALAAAVGPVGVRELAQRASVGPGTVSKVLATLEREGVVSRGTTGNVESVRKRALVERWAQDYGVLTTNSSRWYVAPRGLQALIDRPANRGRTGVATGSLALRAFLEKGTTAITALSQVAFYVPSLDTAARELGLAPVDAAKANVLLLEPYDPKLLQDASKTPVGSVVDPGQAAVDLFTSPGRGPEEAQQLMDALAARDRAWG
jgi:DNA-binding HxlR family transcriptional regulator